MPSNQPKWPKDNRDFLRCYRYLSPAAGPDNEMLMPAENCQPDAQTFHRRKSLTRVAHFAADLPNDLVETLWQRPTALIARGEPLRCMHVRQTVLVEWQSKKYVLKQYVEQSRRHALKRTVQSSRASLTWKFTQRLADSGVATPRPVACIENRWGPLRRDSFLMYPYVEGRTLRSWLAGEAKNSPLMLNQFWQQLEELWLHLVRLRVSLADTNLNNFIVCPAGQLWLIDLDKSRFHRLAFVAARQRARGWNQLLRSAAKCSK